MKDIPCKAVAAFGEVELLECASPPRLVVDEVQRMYGFVDAAYLCNCERQTAWTFLDLQGAHDVHGRHATELERTDEAEHVVPVRRDTVEMDALMRQHVEFAVVGLRVTRQKRVPPMSARLGQKRKPSSLNSPKTTSL